MNKRKLWFGLGLLAGLVYGTYNLASEQNPPTSKPNPMAETEESVLKEKAEALESLYKKLKIEFEVTGAPTWSNLYQAKNEWKMAQAELALARKDRQTQIRYLIEAVESAEKEVKSLALRRDTGLGSRGPEDFYTRAIVRRADTKLALIRARKQLQK